MSGSSHFWRRSTGSWGQGESLTAFAPTKVADERFRQWWARFERLGASPSAVIALMRMNSQIDVRHILPTIRVPTLVLHRAGDTRVNVEGGRYLAANIPGAKYVEFPGIDHVLWATDAWTRRRRDRGVSHRHPRRERTGPGAGHGPVHGHRRIPPAAPRRWAIARWRVLLDQHDRIVRGEIGRFRGREIKTLGDGFLATFDGPARAVRCAGAIIEALRTLSLQVRCGVHTGEIEMKGDDIGGIAVHIASRIAALADGCEVLVSRTVRDLVAGSNLHLEDRGAFALKGLSEHMSLFAAVGSQRA